MNQLEIVFGNIEKFYNRYEQQLLEDDTLRPCKSITRDIFSTIDKFCKYYNEFENNKISKTDITKDILNLDKVTDVVTTNIRVMKEFDFLTDVDKDEYCFTDKFITICKNKVSFKEYFEEKLLEVTKISDMNMIYNGILCTLREGYKYGQIILYPESEDKFRNAIPEKEQRLECCEKVKEIYGFCGRKRDVTSDDYTPNANYRLITILKSMGWIEKSTSLSGELAAYNITNKGLLLLKAIDRNLDENLYNIKEKPENNNPNYSKRITGGRNILLYGVPGAGKSHEIKTNYCSDENFIERVVFHPDYTYSDFVGQILPRVDETNKLKYIFTPGPFTKILKRAYEDPGNEYYLIIEELNRGNAPAIFGEIFQLLDRVDEADDEHNASIIGESYYGISNYDVAKEVYENAEHQVKIPSNMHILATMNTADQNVFTLDTAFQRRWDMKMIKNIIPEKQSKLIIEGTNINWGVFVSVINEILITDNIGLSSSEDKRLGAYFVKKDQLCKEKFANKVLKYLWDDAFKMNRDSIFDNEKYKSLEDIINIYESDEGNKDRLESVLKDEVYKKMISKMKIERKLMDSMDEEEQ